MLRERCLRCGGSDLYHGRLLGQAGLTIISARKLFRQLSATKCVACLTCGAMEPYLEDAAMQKLRFWKTEESNLPPLPPGSGNDPQRQLALIVLMIVAAIMGVVAAVIIPTLEATQKLK